MQIVKKINNNVALARDGRGNELVVFGKGVGFPAMPYELDDLDRIQRTFYNVSKRYIDLLPDLPEALMLAADDIAEEARDELDCELNPNLPFILADHLNFAIQRTRQGVALQNPLSYDVKHHLPDPLCHPPSLQAEGREQSPNRNPQGHRRHRHRHPVGRAVHGGHRQPCAPGL